MFLLDEIEKGFMSFVLSKLKTTKAMRDFKDRWVRDNYAVKTKNMFQAGVADAKALIDLPEPLINDLLNDKRIREEIFIWIIEGQDHKEITIDSIFLEVYYEKYPSYQDQITPFLKLILMKVEEIKKKEWDPEFLEILSKLDVLQAQIESGFNQINDKSIKMLENQENLMTMLASTTTPIEFEDLKELNDNDKVKTARTKAKERLKHATTQEERLELQLVIANSYLVMGLSTEAIPYLYAAKTSCQDEFVKNRITSILKMNESRYEEALEYLEKNRTTEGYKKSDIEILLTIKYNQQNYEECLEILAEHGDGIENIKIQTYIALRMFEEALTHCEELLVKYPQSNDLALFKAQILLGKIEEDFEKGIPIKFDELEKTILPILDSVEEGTENTRQLIRINELKAILYYRKQDFESAIKHYEFILQENMESTITSDHHVYNLILCYYICQKWDKAIALLEQMLEKQVNIGLITILVRIYLEKGEPRKAYKILDIYKASCTAGNQEELTEYCLLKLKTLYLLRRYKELQLFIEKVEKEYNNLVVNLVRGQFSELKHEWESVIQYLEPLLEEAEGEILLEVKLKLLNAYNKRGYPEDLSSIVEIVPTIVHWENHELTINYYIISLYYLQNYDLILEKYHDSSIKKSVKLKEVIAVIYFDNYWYNLSKEIFEEIYYETKNLGFLVTAARCDFYLGNKDECFQTLKFIEKQISENETIHDFQLLALAYMNVREYDIALRYAHEAYKLGEKNPDIWRYYMSFYLNVEKFIESPQKQYIDDFQKVLNTYEVHFPDTEPFMQKLTLFDENDQLHDDMLSMLESGQERQNEILKMFKEKRLPGTFLAEFTGKGAYETWEVIANENSFNFWIDQSGKLSDIPQRVKKIQGTSNILLNSFTLFTLHKLNLLDVLLLNFHIYFEQSDYNRLNEEYSNLLLTGDKGINKISSINGKIYLDEKTAEEVQEEINVLSNIIDWIDLHCKKVGMPVFEKEYDKSNYLDKIGYSILTCRQGLATMMVDSFIIDILANEQNVQTFNTMDFVYYLVKNKKITAQQYYECKAKLITMGYSYIFTEPELYVYVASRDNFKVTEDVKKLFDYLKRDDLNPKFVLGNVRGILQWLNLKSISEVEQIVEILCEIIVCHQKHLEDGVESFIQDCDNILAETFISKLKTYLL